MTETPRKLLGLNQPRKLEHAHAEIGQLDFDRVIEDILVADVIVNRAEHVESAMLRAQELMTGAEQMTLAWNDSTQFCTSINRS